MTPATKTKSAGAVIGIEAMVLETQLLGRFTTAPTIKFP
jgi:hypothetical protein